MALGGTSSIGALLISLLLFESLFQSNALECFKCTYQSPADPLYPRTCDTTQGKLTCAGGSLGCMTFHRRAWNIDGNNLTARTFAGASGLGICWNKQTLKCLQNNGIPLKKPSKGCKAALVGAGPLLKITSTCLKMSNLSTTPSTLQSNYISFCACGGNLCNERGTDTSHSGTTPTPIMIGVAASLLLLISQIKM